MSRKFITRITLAFILLLSFAAFNVQGQATVTTDKEDYIPGETLIITGSGWQPGETVQLHVDETPTLCPNGHNLYATANDNGEIYNNKFIFNESHRGVSFHLTATGQTSA